MSQATTKKAERVYHLTNWQTLALALRVRFYLVRKWPLVTWRKIIHRMANALVAWVVPEFVGADHWSAQ